MENHIFILDDIGDGENEVGLLDVKKQYNPKAERVVVHINSDGGSVETGLSIRDFLTEIPQHVHTIGEGMVASIATMPFLAGDTRELKPNCQFLGHLPSIGGFDGNSDDFERASAYMTDIKDRIADIYSSYTKQDKGAMIEFMRLDKPIFAQKAKEMGFATVVKEFKAVAKININKINKMENTEEVKLTKLDEITNKIIDWFDDTANKLTPKNEEEGEVQNIDLRLEDGTLIFVESEDGELVGKTAYTTDEEGNRTDTAVTEGTYPLDDGRSVVVGADGTVDSVEEASNSEEELKNEIAELKAQLEASNKANDELTQSVENAKKETAESITEMKNVLEEAKDNFSKEINNIKSMTVGGTPVVAKANITKESLEGGEGNHALDKWASKFNN